MRLTCPSCAAAYDVDGATFPASGSHVQCSACHTRWFARAPAPAAAPPSEDQIIARLETRVARARASDASEPPARGPGAGAGEPIAFPVPDRAPPAGAGAGTAPRVQTPLRPRLAQERPAQSSAAPPPRRQGRFGLGVGLALLLAAGALGAYVQADALALRAPAAAPALAVYAGRVDAARDALEARLGPLRDRLAPD